MEIKYQIEQAGKWHKINNFDDIPDNVYSIDCSGNNLFSLPNWGNNWEDGKDKKDLKSFKNLYSIYCDDNYLGTLPNWSNLPNLHIISCSYSNINNAQEIKKIETP